MRIRQWIARSFWSGAVLTLILLLALMVALVLKATGDRTGFSGVWGVFLVSAVAWCLNFVALVGLLAWNVIDESCSESRSCRPSDVGQSTSQRL